MVKVQLVGATAELVRALKKTGMTNKTVRDDWYYKCNTINEAMDGVGLKISVDWLSTDCDGFVEASYYSENIGHVIKLDCDVRYSQETVQELAEVLVRYNDEARALEARLPKIRAVNGCVSMMHKADIKKHGHCLECQRTK